MKEKFSFSTIQGQKKIFENGFYFVQVFKAIKLISMCVFSAYTH